MTGTDAPNDCPRHPRSFGQAFLTGSCGGQNETIGASALTAGSPEKKNLWI